MCLSKVRNCGHKLVIAFNVLFYVHFSVALFWFEKLYLTYLARFQAFDKEFYSPLLKAPWIWRFLYSFCFSCCSDSLSILKHSSYIINLEFPKYLTGSLICFCCHFKTRRKTYILTEKRKFLDDNTSKQSTIDVKGIVRRLKVKSVD